MEFPLNQIATMAFWCGGPWKLCSPSPEREFLISLCELIYSFKKCTLAANPHKFDDSSIFPALNDGFPLK